MIDNPIAKQYYSTFTGKGRTTITQDIRHIFEESELEEIQSVGKSDRLSPNILRTQLTKEGMLQFSTTRKQDYENCKLKRSINSALIYEFEQKRLTHEQFCWHITYTWLPLTDQQIDELELKHVIK